MGNAILLSNSVDPTKGCAQRPLRSIYLLYRHSPSAVHPQAFVSDRPRVVAGDQRLCIIRF
jgi:hypothetical protein